MTARLRARLPELVVGLVAGAATFALTSEALWAIGVAVAVLLFSELLRRLHRPPAVPAPGDYRPLTKREAEVAVLVARGMSNREIATHLFRGERGIENHIQNSYNKLGLHKRVELTRWVMEREPIPPEQPPAG